MIKVYCDKCGVDCQGVEITLSARSLILTVGMRQEIHLCATCYMALDDWLRQGLMMN
jgi:hypothetical protein